MPAFFLQLFIFFASNVFVIISKPFSSLWIFSRENNFASNAYRINDTAPQCALTCSETSGSYKDELWYDCHRTKKNFSCSTLNSCRNFFIHKSSLNALVAAIYAASVVDKGTYFYNLDFQDTFPLQKSSFFRSIFSGINIIGHICIYVAI